MGFLAPPGFHPDGLGAWGINDAGQVTGEMNVTGNADTGYHAFLFSNGTLQDLGTGTGRQDSGGTAINNSSMIVGSSGYPNPAHAYQYLSGTWTDLGTLGGTYSWANAVNDAGHITGYANTTSGRGDAFFYINGTMQDIGTLPGGNHAEGTGINNSDQIVGWSDTQAFLYTDSTMENLDVIIRSTGGSHAYAINNFGQVTGDYENSTFQRRAFLYSISTNTVQDLGALTGNFSHESYGLALSDFGWVVGSTEPQYVTTTTGRALGFHDGMVVDLNNFTLPGVLLTKAPGINESGQICLNGIPADGSTHGYILTPFCTWPASPVNGDWNTEANWDPTPIPNGPGFIAYFDASSITSVSISANTEVKGVTFKSGASVYTITAPPGLTFTVSGTGINNLSSQNQNLMAAAGGSFGGLLAFQNSASAGTLCTLTSNGGSSASVSGGFISFADSSSAGSAILIANGGSNGGFGGFISLGDSSDASAARVEVVGNGILDISGHAVPGVSIGSLEGSGAVLLGSSKLTIGANNLSTTFSGSISDTGHGSITKIGKGKLTLSGANTYRGGTTVSKGALLVTNTTGSATGTGAVKVTGGTLGGTGTIGGPVTIATGRAVATLAPGITRTPATVTLSKLLTFNATGVYSVDLNSRTRRADAVAAKGVTIVSGATITITDAATSALPSGTAFTLINNTAATPISGTFSNLADGSTVVIGDNTYLISYESGNGNDLTLTVQ